MENGNGHSNGDGINVAEVLLQQENEQLKRRLEQAHSRIQILIRDKERLLEISNHLRAQVNRHEGQTLPSRLRSPLLR